jgi:hypothetical protein
MIPRSVADSSRSLDPSRSDADASGELMLGRRAYTGSAAAVSGSSTLWIARDVVDGAAGHGDYSPFARDFNHDGCTDILWFAPHEGLSPVWRADCNGNFIVEPGVLHPTGAYPVGYGLGFDAFHHADP